MRGDEINDILHLISQIIAILGVAVIVRGVLLITYRLFRLELKRSTQKYIFREREVLRHQLGSHLLLGLEYLIAADIIGTISHPTLNDMALLGSIVVIRTVISHSLQREVDEFDPPDPEDGSS